MSKTATDASAQQQLSQQPAAGRPNSQTTHKPLILAAETSGRTGSVALAAGPQRLAETAFPGPMRHSAELFPAASALLDRFAKKPKQIEHIYISTGPGSFTGLRIAVTMAKIMHLANNAVKIVAVDTLDTIAANAADYFDQSNSVAVAGTGQTQLSTHAKSDAEKTPNRIAAILDAKRGQFFIAAYKLHHNKTTTHSQTNTTHYDIRHTKYEQLAPDCLMTAGQFVETFADTADPIWLLGEGLLYYQDKFKAEGIKFFDQSFWTPKAKNVHLLGWQRALAGRFTNPLTLAPTYLRKPDVKEKT